MGLPPSESTRAAVGQMASARPRRKWLPLTSVAHLGRTPYLLITVSGWRGVLWEVRWASTWARVSALRVASVSRYTPAFMGGRRAGREVKWVLMRVTTYWNSCIWSGRLRLSTEMVGRRRALGSGGW